MLVSALIAGGCSKSGGEAPTEVSKEPVTLKIAGTAALAGEGFFDRYFTNPLKRHHPHITLEFINMSQKGTTFAELLAAGSIPDVVVNYPYNLADLTMNGLAYNMDELIQKHKFDLNRISSEYLESAKTVTGLNYLTGIPMFNNTFALFYNKDVFDRFGVTLPKDGMTWNDVRELAIKLNRMDHGVQYYGLFPDNIFRGAYQASLPFVDLANNKPVFQTEGWKNLFELWGSLYRMPGIEVMPKELNTVNGFKTGQIAMWSGYSSQLPDLVKQTGLNWDVVTYPSMKEAPGVSQRVDSLMLSVTAQSKAKDAAMQLISVLLTDEVQKDFSRNLRASVLKDPKINAEFGKDTPELSSKNVAAFIKPKFALLQPFGFVPVGSAVGIPNDAFTEYLYSGKDINTLLREADEKISKVIAEALIKK